MAPWDDAPFVITLQLDPLATAHFESLRRRYYPPARNRVPAHVTMFHRLAAEHAPTILRDVAEAATRYASFGVSVSGLRSLGGGVAYDLTAPELLSLRAGLSRSWKAWLVPQDRERYRPHVVIANKVSPAHTSGTLVELTHVVIPTNVTAVGIAVWRYHNGPWTAERVVDFSKHLA